jgi:hypothetical protein
MGKELTTSKVGRPTKMNDELTTKIESIFKIGGTIEEACSYAGISDETYRRWMNENEDFMAKMESAQHYADIVAKNVVVDSMIKNKDLNTAKWWLEKRQFRGEQQTNVQVNVLNKLDTQKKDYNLDE